MAVKKPHQIEFFLSPCLSSHPPIPHFASYTKFCIHTSHASHTPIVQPACVHHLPTCSTHTPTQFWASWPLSAGRAAVRQYEAASRSCHSSRHAAQGSGSGPETGEQQ